MNVETSPATALATIASQDPELHAIMENEHVRQVEGAELIASENYASDAAEEVHRWETNFERLSPAHQALLSHHREKHVEAYRCVQQNDAFLSGMLAASFSPAFGATGEKGLAVPLLPARVPANCRASSSRVTSTSFFWYPFSNDIPSDASSSRSSFTFIFFSSSIPRRAGPARPE